MSLQQLQNNFGNFSKEKKSFLKYSNFRESSGTLNNRTELLNMLNEEIYQLKQQIEEQGMHNTSGGKTEQFLKI